MTRERRSGRGSSPRRCGDESESARHDQSAGVPRRLPVRRLQQALPPSSPYTSPATCPVPETPLGWPPRTHRCRSRSSTPTRWGWASATRCCPALKRQISAAPSSTSPRSGVGGQSRTSTFFYVDTLEYLRRGGRIGAAQALLGTALAVKPLLHLQDGEIQPLEKVRTSSRAVARLEELALERAGAEPVDIAVHHLDNAERADALAQRLQARLPAVGQMVVSEVGAVIGAHVGPGLLAVVVAPQLTGLA